VETAFQAVSPVAPFMRIQHAQMGTSVSPLPSLGDSITEGTVKDWIAGVGDWVDVDDVVCIIETDKVAVDVRAESAGFIDTQFIDEGDNVDVGADLFAIREGEKPAASETPAPAASETPAPAATTQQQSSPSSPPPPPTSKPTSKPAPTSVPKPAGGARAERRVKMSRMRLRIAERLKEAQNTAAMLTTFQEVDMTNLIKMRSTHKDSFEKKYGTKLGFMSPFVKAAAQALQEIPAVNAVIDGNDIVYRDYVDVSVAVASPRGLVVPVLRNVEGMSFSDIEGTLAELAGKARDETISLEE
jgi:2-oxoglutarate dehydrogenase E2 component (dihydrolipoamide succinyltransferase)